MFINSTFGLHNDLSPAGAKLIICGSQILGFYKMEREFFLMVIVVIFTYFQGRFHKEPIGSINLNAQHV